MGNITLHIAKPEEAGAVTALLERSYAALLTKDYEPETLRRGMAFLARANPDLLAFGTYYLAKTDSGDLAGAGGWTAMRPGGDKADIKPGVAHVRHFAVDPDYTRQGIGKMLFDRCVQDARQRRQVTQFDCYATLSARRFYEALGFEVIGPFDAPFARDFAFPSLHMRNQLKGT